MNTVGMEQAREWAEAQKISVSIDLVEAAKTHLKFLYVVDQNRFLYEDHALQRAIFRYNAYWLPLLAKHLEDPVCDGPLVVPLDCEWIWHCHRLNPVRYKFDCLKLFGRILNNNKVKSSVQATSKTATEDIWDKMYPEEPFELDLNRPFSRDILQNRPLTQNFTSYDLLSAVKRQISFVYQVSRPYMLDDLFLQETAARYKGFLHLIRTNKQMGLERFSVPTYDIDLMWHTHQLYPDCYIMDVLVGFVVQHDDTDPGKSKGSKLVTGFSETTRHWEQTFGLSYWKAGAMSKGNVPTPVTQVPYTYHVEDPELNASKRCGKEIQFPTSNVSEVCLEFVDIKNLPGDHKGDIVVVLSKKQPDKLLKTKKALSISSNSKEKQVAIFECEPTGEFLLELISCSPSSELKPKFKLLGSCFLSLDELVTSRAQLYTNKWVTFDLESGLEISKPILLHISISFTPSTLAPQVFKLVRSQAFKNDTIQTHVVEPNGKKIMSLHNRNIVTEVKKCAPYLTKEVYCITEYGEQINPVECEGNYLSITGNHGSFKLQKNSGNDDSLLELVGHKMVKIFPGRRLDFEPRQIENQESEEDYLTAVEFSANYPYGKAVALINSKLQTVKAIDEWIVLSIIALAFILFGSLKGEAQISNFSCEGRNLEKKNNKDGEMVKNGAMCGVDGCFHPPTTYMAVEKNGAMCGVDGCFHPPTTHMTVEKYGAMSGVDGCFHPPTTHTAVEKNGAMSGVDGCFHPPTTHTAVEKHGAMSGVDGCFHPPTTHTAVEKHGAMSGVDGCFHPPTTHTAVEKNGAMSGVDGCFHPPTTHTAVEKNGAMCGVDGCFHPPTTHMTVHKNAARCGVDRYFSTPVANQQGDMLLAKNDAISVQGV